MCIIYNNLHAQVCIVTKMHYKISTYTFVGQTVFHSMDHHFKENLFATCGEQTDIWDEQRSEPIRSFTWGVDSVNSVKFNPIEVHVK